MILILQNYLADLTALSGDQPALAARRAGQLMRAIAMAGTVALCACGAYMLRLGTRVRRERRYPPPGMRVIRDTPVLTDDRAGRVGRILIVLSILLAAMALYFPILFLNLTESF